MSRKPRTSKSFSGITTQVMLAGDAPAPVRRAMSSTLGGKLSISIAHDDRSLAQESHECFARGFQMWVADAQATIANGADKGTRQALNSQHAALKRTGETLAALARGEYDA